MNEKYLIVYHADCLDGITAAAVTREYLISLNIRQDAIEAIAAEYRTAYETIASYLCNNKIAELYIVDFSFKKDELLHLINLVSGSIRLFDHHKTAFENLIDPSYQVEKDSREVFQLVDLNGDPTLIYITLDNSESGASLAHKSLNGWCSDTVLPTLVRYVKDYDLYRFTYTHTRAINKWLKLQPKTLRRFCALLKDFQEYRFFDDAKNAGILIANYEDQLEDSLISRGTTPVTINGIKGLCCNAPKDFSSSIGHKLAEKSGTFGATWWQASNGVVNWSLRSIGDSCDVSALAKLLEGGGHKNAAGFSIRVAGYQEGVTLWSAPEYPDPEDNSEEDMHS